MCTVQCKLYAPRRHILKPRLSRISANKEPVEDHKIRALPSLDMKYYQDEAQIWGISLHQNCLVTFIAEDFTQN